MLLHGSAPAHHGEELPPSSDKLWPVGTPALWIGFNLVVLFLLAADLSIFSHKKRESTIWDAAFWSAVWVALSLGFNVWIWLQYGSKPGLEFFTGYVIEKSLSVDNLFVFALVFHYFSVEPRDQHRVLFWGILGALVMRGGLIAAGVALIRRFEWILAFFGAFLIVAGARMLLHSGETVDPAKNPALRWVRKVIPLAEGPTGHHFLVRREGRWMATPLLLVLVVIETADLTFALDSIPAIFSITRDAFIVYSSNVCAILGLRALYFLLARAMPKFQFLDEGLSVVLLFMGAKLVGERWFNIPTHISLLIVVGVLAISIVASLLAPIKKKNQEEKSPAGVKMKTTNPGPGAAQMTDLIRDLASADETARKAAALEIYRRGQELGNEAIAGWLKVPELAALVRARATVGVAVRPEHFEAVRGAAGNPHLADVPPDQDAREFEWVIDAAHLDILTARDQNGSGAIARFLAKFGEGIQQVEFETADVDRATEYLKSHLGVSAIYPATRPGADGTRVNFFLANAGSKKVLVELVELPKTR